MTRPIDPHRLIFLLSGLMALLAQPGMAQEDAQMIEDGKLVSFNYTLTVEGEVIESNEKQDPFVYTQGGGQLLPALEAELEGMTAGKQKVVNLEPADAYGEINDAAFQEVPLDQLPEDARKVGTELRSEGYAGAIRVAEISDDKAVLDLNHPLAGKDITFDVTIVSVEEAPDEQTTE